MPLFDAVLSVTIVVVAIRVLMTPDLFEAVVLFIVFGLSMSIAWVRLDAVDVALAEAAIGAGLTGALFLNALGTSGSTVSPSRRRSAGRWLTRGSAAGLAIMLASVVGRAWFDAPVAAGLGALVDAHIDGSGASNPVTAVLLNFRGYDTLLEVVVLVLAVACVAVLRPPRASSPRAGGVPGPVLLAFVRVLVPWMVLVAGYLLWIGSSAPGGAFHAGAVLGAAGVLLVVTGLASPPTLRPLWQRVAVVVGMLGFLAIALGTMLAGGRFLEYPPGWASTLILVIEGLVAVSVAAVLVSLFAVEQGDKASEPEVRTRGEK